MKDSRNQSVLKFEFEGLDEEQTERFRQSLETIIAQGVLNLHDGKAILDFNYEGVLSGIRFEFNKWRKPKKVDNPLTQ